MSIDGQLRSQEDGHSLFEEAIRQNDISVVSPFWDGTQIVPQRFESGNLSTGAEASAEVSSHFPTLVSQNGTAVLEPVGPVNGAGKRVAVLFSGGPASGGHNVLLGLVAALCPDNTVFGVRSGPKGLIEGDLFEISRDDILGVANCGGFDFLGSDRTKIKSDDQFEAVRQTVETHQLDAIVVIGGDDSNTNAAVLAEYLKPEGCVVVGVPKTIDGDLQAGEFLPISFGFDTATKTYAEMVGNILQDTPSSRKYWHFVKLMGRSASQVTLEVALQTQPAVTLISEEIEAKQLSVQDVVDQIVSAVLDRSKKGLNFGVVLIPEGVIEFIPEFRVLIDELNEILAGDVPESDRRDVVEKQLTAGSKSLLASLPESIVTMLLLDRDSHGNLKVSQVPTEQLFVEMVTDRIRKDYSEVPFSTNSHFFGYEGRCGAPSRFDASFTFNLGLVAGSLVLDGRTGYMAAVSDLDRGGRALGIPLTGLIRMERRHGGDHPVIEKALVQLDSPAFRYFESRRDEWASSDLFSSPGPRQLWGPVACQVPKLVALNQGYLQIDYDLGTDCVPTALLQEPARV